MNTNDEEEPDGAFADFLGKTAVICTGRVRLVVLYTDRTWGTDIVNMLGDQITKCSASSDNIPHFAFMYRKFISALTVAIFLFGIITAQLRHTLDTNNAYQNFVAKNLANNSESLSVIIEKLNMLLERKNIVQQNLILESIFILFMLTMMTPKLYKSLVKMLSVRPPSLIHFTEKDIAENSKEVKKYARNWIKALVATCTGIALGVASNLAYSYIF
jgi:hypothetical protein